MGKANDGASYHADSKPPSGLAGKRPDNPVETAARLREFDEQKMQNLLQEAQRHVGVFNTDIEPEHDPGQPCSCVTCDYRRRKLARRKTHDVWSEAVLYPGEKTYNDFVVTVYCEGGTVASVSRLNPYVAKVPSAYGSPNRRRASGYFVPRPSPRYHMENIHQTIKLNNEHNARAQAAIEVLEPANIWGPSAGQQAFMGSNREAPPADEQLFMSSSDDSKKDEKGPQNAPPSGPPPGAPATRSIPSDSSSSKGNNRLSGLFSKLLKSGPTVPVGLKETILEEEAARWPDVFARQIVMVYQEKVGMTKKIADLRERHPIQYLHLLRAGYFEPIPTRWSELASNPLKFTIDPAGGWRGITPSWRGYGDTAEERLYWVLNHREGISTMRMKPDFISEMNMARVRMARAVEPPPEYFDPTDQCHLQHKSQGYSKQILPTAFRPYDPAEISTDDTMILLDVSGSMDKSVQPKNKDVAKAIVKRFTHAMAKHDHLRRESGYDFVTFSSSANYIGLVSDDSFESVWADVKVGGGTRVMTGWQKVKEIHFKKHGASATHHPVFGWQAGPETPMLRLLLLLDGEATDMDEFELDLLGLSWAHVTIFLIGVEGCPHHHRHANELQRISDVNHHVNFVDAQGNTPERFVTHELLKRHLGMDISMLRFTELEDLPAYAAVI